MPSLISLLIYLFGFLVLAALSAFSLLKGYDEFMGGRERKKRLKIWGSFFSLSFLFMILTFSLERMVFGGKAGDLGHQMLVIFLVLPPIAALSAFALLKANDLYLIGVKKHSRLRIWGSFLIGSSLFIIVSLSIAGIVRG